MVGFSSHIVPVRNVAPRNAVSAMSVVDKPACASMVGSNVKAKTASTATTRLK